MKSISIALASLLCASSAGAEDLGRIKNTLSGKPIALTSRSSPTAVTPRSSGEVREPVVHANKTSLSVKNTSVIAQAGTVAPGSRPAVPAKEGPNEIVEQNKDKNKDKNDDKPVEDKPKEVVFKEMVVTGDVERDSHYTSPSTRVNRAQIELQNAQTTEEVLKYQPSLQIRQRYVGDPNGVLGIRGADMFSTARNMVFADGLPLHNFLQASFNGAPRWSLVGPNEIDAVDIVYGPFSAEYSGNSIGGVVNIKTRMPRKQEFYFEGSLFIQPYKLYGPDQGTFVGDRQYVSYGNRIQDRFTVFLAYNRLEGQSHPQSYFIDNTGLFDVPGGVPVTGGLRTPDTRGTPSIIYGDTGPEKVHTHLLKGKFGYDITQDLQAIFTVAYEDRTRSQDRSRNYVSDITGQPFWGGAAPPCSDIETCATPGNASLDGTRFDVVQRGFGGSQDKRETLNLGLAVTWRAHSKLEH